MRSKSPLLKASINSMATDADSMVSPLSSWTPGTLTVCRNGLYHPCHTWNASGAGDGPGMAGEAPDHAGQAGDHQEGDGAPEPQERAAEGAGQDGGGEEDGEGSDHGAGQVAEVPGADEDTVEHEHHGIERLEGRHHPQDLPGQVDDR